MSPPAGRGADATIRATGLRPVRFGLVPTTRELRDTAFLTGLARLLGPLWSIHSFRSYAALVDALADGAVEAAWLPPLAYARASRTGAVDLVLTLERAGQPSYAAAIVVRDTPQARDLGYVQRKRAA